MLKGVSAITPLTGKELPIFISDYVLASFGTGAIMAVPAHDERDWEFATKFKLPIIPVLSGGNVEEAAFAGDENSVMINSEIIDGLSVADAKEKIISYMEQNQIGERKINFKLRDWIFSRQR